MILLHRRMIEAELMSIMNWSEASLTVVDAPNSSLASASERKPTSVAGVSILIVRSAIVALSVVALEQSPHVKGDLLAVRAYGPDGVSLLIHLEADQAGAGLA